MKLEDIQQFPPVQVKLRNGVQVTIRPLSIGDGEALSRFYAGVPLEDIRFYCPHRLDRAHALENAARAFNPLEVVLVLETPSGEIEGYAWYRWNSPDAKQSGVGICISRRLHGYGAGRALMQRLLTIAESIGPPVMTLTVQVANERAAALYRQMGFHIVREQMRGPHMYGFPPEPEYYMERRIREPSVTQS